MRWGWVCVCSWKPAGCVIGLSTGLSPRLTGGCVVAGNNDPGCSDVKAAAISGVGRIVVNAITAKPMADGYAAGNTGAGPRHLVCHKGAGAPAPLPVPSSPFVQFPRLNLAPKNLLTFPVCFSALGVDSREGSRAARVREKSPAGIRQDLCAKPRQSAKNGKRSYAPHLRRAQHARRRGAAWLVAEEFFCRWGSANWHYFA